jgi:DNA-binding CsgD family transcriptional regulator
MARDLMLMNAQIDVRMLLSEIHSPTLVLHRGDDRWVEVGNGRYLASHIVGAKFVELSGADHRPWVEDADAVLDQVQAAICGTLRRPRHANSSLGVLALSRREHEIVLLAVAGQSTPDIARHLFLSEHTCATPIRNSTSAPSSNSPDEHPNSASKPIRREISSGSGDEAAGHDGGEDRPKAALRPRRPSGHRRQKP